MLTEEQERERLRFLYEQMRPIFAQLERERIEEEAMAKEREEREAAEARKKEIARISLQGKTKKQRQVEKLRQELQRRREQN
jgi:hypothetical protein